MFGEKGFIVKLIVTKIADFVTEKFSKSKENNNECSIDVNQFNETMRQALMESNHQIENMELLLNQAMQLLFCVINYLHSSGNEKIVATGNSTINLFFVNPHEINRKSVESFIRAQASKVLKSDIQVDSDKLIAQYINSEQENIDVLPVSKSSDVLKAAKIYGVGCAIELEEKLAKIKIQSYEEENQDFE